MTDHGFIANAEFFSIATQVYARLRRVSGRVVDAMYMAQNPEYAKYIITLAQSTQDAELLHYATRLSEFISQSTQPDSVLEQSQLSFSQSEDDLQPGSTATEEEVYKAQVPHHYIGFLR
ncbi:hypothetical protein F4V57_04020 [Acinetobacter qingfengensis]|uniref:Uncharacterized protein n=1 Tax=Acinetobacter qingfengensis TaxID=1262585 RepID=A0A1E7R1R5_9GAMM|nr:hypothetical protein [Acinetobacter qingfengensis]KAA8734934.1 hypothetical protein F4V57_04020 [Acinetobacter qingfengensis]OEY93264.1 hypothetical protein BJI46_14365 [Acinetobacter qingfengensis]